MPRPEFKYIEFHKLTEEVQALRANKKQFLMYVDKKFTKSHGLLKILERKHSILTQHVTFELIEKAGGASITNGLNTFFTSKL